MAEKLLKSGGHIGLKLQFFGHRKAKLYRNFLDFGPFFTPRSHMGTGQHWVYGPKTTLKLLVHVLALVPNPWLEIVLPKFWA